MRTLACTTDTYATLSDVLHNGTIWYIHFWLQHMKFEVRLETLQEVSLKAGCHH